MTPKTRLDILRCRSCGLWLQGAPPTSAERQAIYSERYYEGWGLSPETQEKIRAMKRKTFAWAFRRVGRYTQPGRLLDVGCAFGASLEVAQERGWDVYGLEVNPYAVDIARRRFGSRIMAGDFDSAQLEEGAYDAVLLWDVLEHLPEPRAALERTNRLLRPQGLVVINTPSTASLSAKLLGGLWPQLKAEHLCYLAPRHLGRLLEETGFRALSVGPSVKALTLRYVNEVMAHYPVWLLSRWVKIVAFLVPSRLRDLSVHVRTGEMFAIARNIRA